LYLLEDDSTLERKTVTWKKTTFERQKLFDEVWTTPVTKLAKGYGLSDVGLRKICIALDVPLPPRGYWPKLAAGKTIPKPALQKTTLPTTYERVVYVAAVDEVLEERVAKARDSIHAGNDVSRRLLHPDGVQTEVVFQHSFDKANHVLAG
jgi:hypothetical protein